MGIFTPHPSATNQPMENYALHNSCFLSGLGWCHPVVSLGFLLYYWQILMWADHGCTYTRCLWPAPAKQRWIWVSKTHHLAPTEYVISSLCIFMASGTNLDVVGCFLDMGKVVEIGHTFSFFFFFFLQHVSFGYLKAPWPWELSLFAHACFDGYLC